ncbi:transmembrane protein 199-like [Plakobranchus ocellatus]|uniref:Transmembrane protein 199-like n=1 Tax=Plakobranchus ocellatus TaxID=259542 RepID=A0AAV4D3V0_9GAST|nr:transmembrane protein 199-like [Plakobranchus ocellatus]
MVVYINGPNVPATVNLAAATLLFASHDYRYNSTFKMASDSTTKHRQPELTVTPEIVGAAEKVLNLQNVNSKLREQCVIIQQRQCVLVSTKTLRDIYKTLRNEGEKIFLHELVKRAELVPQSVSLPPRDPELEARVQKLKIAEENREYERMTRNVTQRGNKSFSFQEDVKNMNRQIIAMLNFVLTVVAGFAFGYKGTEYIVGKLFAMQLMSGLIMGTIVFFVDLYFIMRYGV